MLQAWQDPRKHNTCPGPSLILLVDQCVLPPTSLQTLEMEIWAGKQQTRSCLGLDLPTGLQCHLSLFKQLREARGRKAM